jgi:hypothetical protein
VCPGLCLLTHGTTLSRQHRSATPAAGQWLLTMRPRADPTRVHVHTWEGACGRSQPVGRRGVARAGLPRAMLCSPAGALAANHGMPLGPACMRR